MSDKLTIAVDFDGVLFPGEWTKDDRVEGPPVEGAVEFVTDAVKKYRVVVYSTRCDSAGGRRAILGWLGKHGFPAPKLGVLEIGCRHEVAAYLYLDDRGYRFNGTFQGVRQFLVENQSLRTWRESGMGDTPCAQPIEQPVAELAQWQRLEKGLQRPTPHAGVPVMGPVERLRMLRPVRSVPSGSARAAGVHPMTGTCAMTANRS